MIRPYSTLVALPAVLVLVSACELAPTYHAPPVATPPTFKESAGWSAAQPADGQPRGDWWRMFDDSDLDGIEQQVSEANQDLKAAAARFEQARALARIARADLYPTIDAGAKGASGELSHAVSN